MKTTSPLAIALAFGAVIFTVVFATTDGFARGTQELIASSDVIVRAAAPTVNDDIDFNILKGVIWIDTAGGAVYINEDNTNGAAVWTDITAGGSTFNAEEGDVLVSSNVSVIDFGAGFDLTDSPSGEANVLLDYSEDPVNLSGLDVTGTLDISDHTNLAAGTGATLTGDSLSVDLGTSIETGEITDGTITEPDLAAVDTPADEECLTYEATGGDFEWQVCGSGGSGTVSTIKQDGVQVGDADIVTIDFGDGLTCTELPDTEINCVVDLGESIDLTAEVTGILPAANGGTGQSSTTADGVLVANGSTFVLRVIPDCNSAGNALNYDITTDAFTCATGYLTTVDLTSDVTGALPVGNGGTGQTAATADGLLVGNGTSFTLRVVPDCDTAGNALNYDITTDAFTCATGYLTTVDISDNTNLVAGTNITLTGDTLNVDDAFLLNTGDVGTGAYDFGGADSLELPNGAGGTIVNAAGEITIDTTSETVNFYDGTEEKVLQPIRRISITVEDPTNAEDISIMHTQFAVTILREMCVLVGSATPSVTVTLRHGTDRSAVGAELNTSGNAITSTTTGNEDTTFNDATIVADSFIWLETTAQSGTVDLLSCTWEYTVDA